jgi:hypothetical protein
MPPGVGLLIAEEPGAQKLLLETPKRGQSARVSGRFFLKSGFASSIF